MRQLALLTFVTLDGVMQGPTSPDEDPSGGFDRGGWAGPYWEGVMDQVVSVAMNAPYDMLFGRKTYQMFAGHWPNVANDPVADRMNAARKYVVSRSEPDLPWGPAETISGDVPARIAELKAADGPLLQVHGSGALCQTLLAEGLVDELRLWTFPVTVGAGRKLFAGSPARQSWQLTASAAAPNGVHMTIHRRA